MRALATIRENPQRGATRVRGNVITGLVWTDVQSMQIRTASQAFA
jgi:hypothetical protein